MVFLFHRWYSVVLEAGRISRKENNELLERDKDEQWAEALSLWVDQKAAAYLKENHSRFETTLEEQRRLAEK